jgi:hypothetical protein
MVRVRFAGVVVHKGWLECSFWLKRRMEDPRFSRVEKYTSRDFGYFFRLKDPWELDGQVRDWIREAYAIGCQAARS